jgi:hypothetical protein
MVIINKRLVNDGKIFAHAVASTWVNGQQVNDGASVRARVYGQHVRFLR